jgi:dephospho-CoA kinase
MSGQVVGLTGGIASGKSTVAAMFAELGAVVVDADALVSRILTKGSPVLAEVAETFGGEVLKADGSLDRAALADKVFDDPAARKRLELITHPRVAALAAERITEAQKAGARVIVYDAALLVETGAFRTVDVVVVVEAPVETRLQRLRERKGMEPDEAKARMAAQLDDSARSAVADHVIHNDSDLNVLRSRVKLVWETLV